MVEDVGTTITLEAWDNKYKPNQDWNHAWGAAPANLLPRYVLGVEPLTPGYAKTLIWPRAAAEGGPASAKGKVPTVKGPIEVAWERTAAGFHVTVALPANVIGEVRVPAQWGTQVHVDGSSHLGLAKGGVVALEVPAGRHEIIAGR